MSLDDTNLALEDASVVSAENPWPGLLSFRESDQRWFQGRREETAELLQHVKRERLTVLFALSGIGKSSLLQAGLFPALRRESIFPVYIRLDYAAQDLDLRAQVLEAIAQAGDAAEIKVPAPRYAETLWEYLHNLEAEFWNKQQCRVLPLLVFDQFEEIFTLGMSEDRVQASESFLDELADLAEGTPPRAVAQRWVDNPVEKDDYTEEGEYKLLISLREDFLPELADQHRRIAGVPQERYRIRQMNGEGALLAVSQAKDLIDETVAQQIVRYVAAGERVGLGPLKDLVVEPALLSVVCRELNSRRRKRSERKISADLLEGSREQVLSDFYASSLAGMAPPVRTFIEEQLITRAGTRNSVALDDALAVQGITATIVEDLVERRLLRKEYRRNEVRIELTHDLLTGVVGASRTVRRNEEALEKQRKEKEEANKKLRRSRVVTLAFACIAGLALASAFVAFQQLDKARTETRRATEAKRQADAATALANAATAEAELEKKNALANLTEEERQKLLKEEQAQLAEKNEALAKRNEAEALQAKARANRSEKQAIEKGDEAEREKIAETKAEQAEKQKEQDEIAQRIRAEAAESDKEKVARTLAIENAKSRVSEAAGFVSTGQFARALGYVARALTLDENSLAAKSLAFDQLLRGRWPSAVDPKSSGAQQFVHLPMVHPAEVLFAVFSPNGRYVATASRDGKIRLWDLQAGTPPAEMGTHEQAVRTVAFSPDGQRLVSASYDKTAKVWNVNSRSKPLELKHDMPVESAMFSTDGGRIVTASQDKTAQVWDAYTGTTVGPPLPHPKTVKFAAFSPDGSRVVTACGDSVHVWDLATSTDLFQVPHPGEVESVVFSPDGKRFVTAAMDGNARIWDVTTRLLVGQPLQSGSGVYYASFSGDGKRVATASNDGTARVWEAATGLPMTAPLAHKKRVLAATFSHDGRRLVTASYDCTAQVWEVWYDFDNTADLIKLLEGLSGIDSSKNDLRQLTKAEQDSRINEVRAKASQQPATSFLRWFFAHRL